MPCWGILFYFCRSNSSHVKTLFFQYLKLFFFWILIFDFQKILFTIRNLDKFNDVGVWEWLQAFFYSFRLDLGTAGALSVLPALLLTLRLLTDKQWIKYVFYILLMTEALFVALIHSGEINAYSEWNHKLTSRVFTHLQNPDEVFRTADWTTTVFYFIYLIVEITFSYKIMRWLFTLNLPIRLKNLIVAIPAALLSFAICGTVSFTVLRGGFQPIPMNINAAMYSKHPVANDVSVNSLYFFAKSYLLYNRTNLDEYMPDIDPVLAQEITEKMMSYPKGHSNYFLKEKRPNIVVVVLEGWAGQAISSLSETRNSTPFFDKIAQEGVLFTEVYAASGTSEIGNSSVFSGFPGIPEVSITMQPEKNRNIRCINQDLQPLGYTSSYLFSGDLKYGNIGGYFLDHGFDNVKDENDFPKNIKRGKLNYYDDDLYDFFLREINRSKSPFLQCAFTGSTHFPYDQPASKRGKVFSGVEADFMNALVYSDEALGRFTEKVKKESWFENTVFIFVADHGHPVPLVTNPSTGIYNHIPLLFWGGAVKEEYRGKRINQMGSQADIAATLFYQMGLDSGAYPWSKDLMNPSAPQFALHTITRGYGWITPKGNFTYEMQSKVTVEDNFPEEVRKQEHQNCFAFLTEVYNYYKSL